MFGVSYAMRGSDVGGWRERDKRAYVEIPEIPNAVLQMHVKLQHA